MKPLLMFEESDFQVTEAELPQAGDLTKDLDLETVWRKAARDDDTILTSVRTAMLSPLVSPDQINFRLDVLDDCLQNPAEARDMYALVHTLIREDEQIFRSSYFRLRNESMLDRAAAGLKTFLTSLRKLREMADSGASAFTSRGFAGLIETIRRELDDEFFEAITAHLRTLHFRDGPLASAQLGHLSQGVDYTLRIPSAQNESRFLSRRPPVGKPYFSRTIAHDDQAGHQELDDLRDRIFGLAATAVAQALQHVREFYEALHTELGFYIGCLNLHEEITASGQPVCRPMPYAVGSGLLMAAGLRNPCLTLHGAKDNCANDLRADGKSLVLITGANQGGKSTFLRGIGIAYLMMQCGMFVCARSFTAGAVDGIHTHFAREEDPTMTRGKFDEELARMSLITKQIHPGGLLLCNETFASTNEREGAEIATEVISALTQSGVTVVFVTHLYELAHRYYERADSTALCLRAERNDDGRRSFHIQEAEPLPTSYGEDVFWKTFGVSQAQESPAPTP